jgi:hypothetical protein
LSMANKKKEEFKYVSVDRRLFKWAAKKKISSSDFVLYCYLMIKVNPYDPDSLSWPGNETLKRECGLGEDAVQSGLQNLERCGIISLVSKSKYANKRKYKINLRVVMSDGGEGIQLTREPIMPVLNATEWRSQRKRESKIRNSSKQANPIIKPLVPDEDIPF